MNDDLPPDLPRLETLRAWHAMWLERIDAKIARVRQAEAGRRRAEAGRAGRAPEWLLEQGLNRDAPPVYVHVGGCHMAGPRCVGVGRQDAVRALAAGVEACTHCRPDAELGFLDV